jgi:hypothetical protein
MQMRSRTNGFILAALTAAMLTTGCKSAAEKANDAAVAQAKQQAITTGSAQQVVSTDKDGNTVTTVVQPPVPGQTTQQVTVTKTTRSANSTNTTSTTRSDTVVAPMTAVAGPVDAGRAVAPADPLATDPRLATSAQPAPLGPVISPVNLEVPAGTRLDIRVNQRISVKTAHAGDRFTGEVVHPVLSGNSTAIPSGTPVEGIIDASHRRGHFKGASILELRLVSMRLNGQRYALDTADNVRGKKGKGKRSTALIAGGTGAGMLIGGLATGGVGLVVGGLIGGGAGTGIAGLTGNRDIIIPAESVVSFRLADDLAVSPQ